jgi:two-component system LytT family response regulator
VTTDPAHAVTLLREEPPDVVFLDVQMPGLSGFDVLAQFPEPDRSFAVVFCTAYDAHATRAFDAAALDYLVKPVEATRLSGALARARRFVRTLGPEVASSDLTRARASGLFKWLDRLVVRSPTGARVVEVSDVVVFASEAHRTVAYTTDEEHVLDPSLAALEPQLDPRRFVRSHRAFVVNVTRVEQAADDVITLKGGRRVPLSRRNRAAFLAALHAVHRR